MSGKAVRISYAYDAERDCLISVAKAVKGKDYECHGCHGRLRKRSGEQRREHFYHLEDSNCSISYETSLHFGAKLFLKERLTDGLAVEIVFPTRILPDNEFKSLLAKEEIERIQIPVQRLLQIPLCIHETELAIGNSSFKADVISQSPQKQTVMVWEIVVTHGIDSEKRSWLSDNRLPFIELKPSEKGYDEFAFEVVSYGNLNCLKPDAFKLASLLDVYQKELNEKFSWVYIRQFLENIDDLVFDQLVENTSNALFDVSYRPTDHVDDVRDFFMREKSFEIKQTFIKGREPEEFRSEKLKNIATKATKFGPAPRFNEKYWANSPLNLCGELFIQFSKKVGNILGKVDAAGNLVSAECSLFISDFRKAKIHVAETEIEGFTQMLSLEFLVFDKTNPADPHYRIRFPECSEGDVLEQPDARLTFPAGLFVKFLIDLMQIAQIDLIIGRNEKGFEDVYGLKIEGVYSIKAFNLAVRKSVVDSLKDIFFNPPPKIPAGWRVSQDDQ